MGDFVLDAWRLVGLACTAGIFSFVIAAAARAGCDWAGLHTRKAKIVQEHFIASKGNSQ